MGEQKIKTIDLSKVTAVLVDGTTQEFDVHKSLATTLYATPNPGQGRFAMELYANPIVELTEENKEYIQTGLEQGGFFFNIKEAILELLNT